MLGHMGMQGLTSALRRVACIFSALFVLPVLLRRADLQMVRPNTGSVVAQMPDLIVFIQNKTGTPTWPASIRTKFGTFAATELFPADNENCDLNRPNGIYVMGDNLDHSEDSRDYGPVTASDVYGKVLGR